MAFENTQICFSAKTTADLSGSQYYLVEMAGDSKVNLQSSNITACAGVLQNKPKSGYHARVCPLGISRVIVGNACSYGNKLYAAGSGYAMPMLTVGSGKPTIGWVIHGAASGMVATAFMHLANAVSQVTSVL